MYVIRTPETLTGILDRNLSRQQLSSWRGTQVFLSKRLNSLSLHCSFVALSCVSIFFRFRTSFSSAVSVEILYSLLRAPFLSTMAFYIFTKCIMVASIFFSLSSCAPIKLQEGNEDPDLYRNAVRWFLLLLKCGMQFYDATVSCWLESLWKRKCGLWTCLGDEFQVLYIFFRQSAQWSDTFYTKTDKTFLFL